MEVRENGIKIRKKGSKGPRVSSKAVPFSTKNKRQRVLKRKEPSKALKREIALAKREKEAPRPKLKAERKRREREREERKAREELRRAQENGTMQL